jgi:hypothetical protein
MRAGRFLLLYVVPCLLIGGAVASYEYFIGFPRTFAGRRVHRITAWSPDNRFQRQRKYYAYTGAGGKEVNHGLFEMFEDGHLVQRTLFKDGKVDGAIVYWNLLGDKTQEIYYHNGIPYGYANFARGNKLVSLREEIAKDGRTVAVKSFADGHFSLVFNCGELIDAAIDSVSGQINPIPNATQRACAQP